MVEATNGITRRQGGDLATAVGRRQTADQVIRVAVGVAEGRYRVAKGRVRVEPVRVKGVIWTKRGRRGRVCAVALGLEGGGGC